jgi:hypothetical protein
MNTINFRTTAKLGTDQPMAKRVGVFRRLLWRVFGRKRERYWF